MKEISAEERQRRAAKAAQTVKERRERKETEEQAKRNDQQRAIELCRKIRDDENAADADRLHAIELLKEYTV